MKKANGKERRCKLCGSVCYPNYFYCQKCHGIVSSTYEHVEVQKTPKHLVETEQNIISQICAGFIRRTW